MQVLSANSSSIISAYEHQQRSTARFAPRQEYNGIEVIPSPQFQASAEQQSIPSFAAPQGNYIDLYV